MSDTPAFIDHLLQLIARDKLKTAIAELQTLLQGSPAYDEAILQSARYNGLMKDIRTGTIDPLFGVGCACVVGELLR